MITIFTNISNPPQVVVQSRLCRYSFYQTNCCKSCSYSNKWLSHRYWMSSKVFIYQCCVFPIVGVWWGWGRCLSGWPRVYRGSSGLSARVMDPFSGCHRNSGHGGGLLSVLHQQQRFNNNWSGCFVYAFASSVLFWTLCSKPVGNTSKFYCTSNLGR